VKYPGTYKALRAFSLLFFVLSALIVIGSVGVGLFAIFAEGDASIRLATFFMGTAAIFIFALIYGSFFLFLGFVSRALSYLIGEIK